MKKIIHFKGNEMKESYGGCNNIPLAPSSEFVESYWWEIIKDVFSYEKERNAGLQEIHKLITDDRILKGLELYKSGKVKEGAITDVDVRATVSGEDGEYNVILKNWKPDKLLRYRYEMERYIAELFVDCSCKDHTINGHYRNNSSLFCKHISAVIWKLIIENNFPKILLTPIEKKEDWYDKSKTVELATGIYGVPMKQFNQFINILVLRDFKGIPTSLAYSIHKEPNKGYEKLYPDGIKPTWITFLEPGAVKTLLEANLKGYIEMLASRGNTEEQIKKEIKDLFPGEVSEVNEQIKNLQYKLTIKDKRLSELYNALHKRKEQARLDHEKIEKLQKFYPGFWLRKIKKFVKMVFQWKWGGEDGE